eukprot:11104964-Prorocentrum_lima.AAC.1
MCTSRVIGVEGQRGRRNGHRGRNGCQPSVQQLDYIREQQPEGVAVHMGVSLPENVLPTGIGAKAPCTQDCRNISPRD